MDYALFGHTYQSDHSQKLSQLFSALRRLDPSARIFVDAPFYEWLKSRGVHVSATATFEGEDFDADLCLSFGGDGTLLHTARRVGNRQIPVMGINTGHLGYLTTAGITNPDDTARMIAGGHYRIESRSMLRARATDCAEDCEAFALNEVAVTRQDSASMISVEARIGGRLLAVYRADGLIISTPTGSTGYNLSVGGPIMAPGTGVWVISPIAAHTLTMRPLVIPDTSEVTLAIRSRSGSYLVSYDGSAVILPESSGLTIDRAPFVTRIAVALGNDFVDTLREKLLWGI